MTTSRSYTLNLTDAERSYLVELLYAPVTAQSAPERALQQLDALSKQYPSDTWERLDNKVREAKQLDA
jgi:hypothetical protein